MGDRQGKKAKRKIVIYVEYADHVIPDGGRRSRLPACVMCDDVQSCVGSAACVGRLILRQGHRLSEGYPIQRIGQLTCSDTLIFPPASCSPQPQTRSGTNGWITLLNCISWLVETQVDIELHIE